MLALALAVLTAQPAVTPEPPRKSSALIFRSPEVEGGYHGLPSVVEITVSGKDSDLVLKQILERLGEKPLASKP
jgi:hypothetical protein